MTKTQAIFDLIAEGRSRRDHSTAAATRTVRACRALGLDKDETVRIVHGLGFCNDDGEPYSKFVKKVW